MSEQINWKPKEEKGKDQGLPVCGAEAGKCDYAPHGCCGNYCMPQICKQHQALVAFMEWNSGPDAGMENSAEVWNAVVEQIIEAMTP